MINRTFKIKTLFYLLSLVFSLYLGGCGYTTTGFKYQENKVFITPVKNKIDITSESRNNSDYVTFPLLLEKRLTNKLVNKFNVDGHLKVVSIPERALTISCEITNYQKEALRYTDDKSVQEQRLRLFLHMKLIDSKEEILKDKEVVGETSYYLSGSEEAAQEKLIDDAARRVLEAVIEEW